MLSRRAPLVRSAWNYTRDMTPLSPEDIKKYIDSGKKGGDLLAGYKTAQNPQAWLDDREQTQRAYEELQRQAAAEAEEHEDQLQSEDGGSKRKRGSDKKEDKEDKKKKKAKLDKLAKGRVSTQSVATRPTPRAEVSIPQPCTGLPH